MRASVLAAQGLSGVAVGRMVEKGRLQRIARGIYAPAGFRPTEHHGLATAAAMVPHGVICLLSALQFYRLGTQSPFEVWLAINRTAHKPTPVEPPLRIVRFSTRALEDGVQTYLLEGVSVKINLLTDGLPNFTAYPTSGKNPGLPHLSTMHIRRSLVEMV